MPSDNIESLLRSAKAGDMPAFAKLLTQIEHMTPEQFFSHGSLLEHNKPAFRIGITGPPGSGKSTLIGHLLAHFSQQNLKVGVLAIDPTSPISKGAILGDRIRYAEHSCDPNIFIRSLGTRGSLGGLSAVAYLMLRLFDLCAFDLVIVETVGVGQVEVEIMNVADAIAVVLVPESGDSVQIMKAGILEIADLFIVNKSDRPGAEVIRRELEANIELNDGPKKPKVFLTSALNSVGLSEVIEELLHLKKLANVDSNRESIDRLRAEAFSLMRAKIELLAKTKIENLKTPNDLVNLFKDSNY